MSDRGPGTRAHVIDTIMIAGAGLVLAIWLWDGWPFAFEWVPAAAPGSAAQPTLGDYFDAGCITHENLQAMREGRTTRVTCQPGTTAP